MVFNLYLIWPWNHFNFQELNPTTNLNPLLFPLSQYWFYFLRQYWKRNILQINYNTISVEEILQLLAPWGVNIHGNEMTWPDVFTPNEVFREETSLKSSWNANHSWAGYLRNLVRYAQSSTHLEPNRNSMQVDSCFQMDYQIAIFFSGPCYFGNSGRVGFGTTGNFGHFWEPAICPGYQTTCPF